MEQVPRQSPGSALNAFMTLLCLVINYIIAGAVVIALCVSVRGMNRPQGRNCVCLVYGQAFWHSTWYTVGA